MAGLAGQATAGSSIGMLTQPARRPVRGSAGAVETSSGAGQLSSPGLPLLPSLGPYLQVQGGFAERNAQWTISALQSGVKTEVAAALNALSLLAFAEKDVPRREQALVTRMPGLLDALVHLIGEWRNVHWTDLILNYSKSNLLGQESANTSIDMRNGAARNGWEPSESSSWMLQGGTTDIPPHVGNNDERSSDWTDDGLFNLDDAARAEKQLAAVAASNVLRSLSCLPESAPVMAEHRRCLEVLFVCLLDHETEDEELVTNAVEIITNIAHFIDLRQFSEVSTVKEASAISEEELLQALQSMLEAPVKAWHYGASEALARLLLNPDNETALAPLGSKVFERLATLLGRGDPDVQGAAVAALAAFAELGSSCKLQLGRQRWIVPRLLSVVRAPHPVAEICRRAATALESLGSEYKNRESLLAYEQQIAEIAMSENKCAEHMARLLWELNSDVGLKENARWSIWGA